MVAIEQVFSTTGLILDHCQANLNLLIIFVEALVYVGDWYRVKRGNKKHIVLPIWKMTISVILACQVKVHVDQLLNILSVWISKNHWFASFKLIFELEGIPYFYRLCIFNGILILYIQGGNTTLFIFYSDIAFLCKGNNTNLFIFVLTYIRGKVLYPSFLKKEKKNHLIISIKLWNGYLPSWLLYGFFFFFLLQQNE